MEKPLISQSKQEPLFDLGKDQQFQYMYSDENGKESVLENELYRQGKRPVSRLVIRETQRSSIDNMDSERKELGFQNYYSGQQEEVRASSRGKTHSQIAIQDPIQNILYQKSTKTKLHGESSQNMHSSQGFNISEITKNNQNSGFDTFYHLKNPNSKSQLGVYMNIDRRETRTNQTVRQHRLQSQLLLIANSQQESYLISKARSNSPTDTIQAPLPHNIDDQNLYNTQYSQTQLMSSRNSSADQIRFVDTDKIIELPSKHQKYNRRKLDEELKFSRHQEFQKKESQMQNILVIEEQDNEMNSPERERNAAKIETDGHNQQFSFQHEIMQPTPMIQATFRADIENDAIQYIDVMNTQVINTHRNQDEEELKERQHVNIGEDQDDNISITNNEENKQEVEEEELQQQEVVKDNQEESVQSQIDGVWEQKAPTIEIDDSVSQDQEQIQQEQESSDVNNQPEQSSQQNYISENQTQDRAFFEPLNEQQDQQEDGGNLMQEEEAGGLYNTESGLNCRADNTEDEERNKFGNSSFDHGQVKPSSVNPTPNKDETLQEEQFVIEPLIQEIVPQVDIQKLIDKYNELEIADQNIQNQNQYEDISNLDVDIEPLNSQSLRDEQKQPDEDYKLEHEGERKLALDPKSITTYRNKSLNNDHDHQYNRRDVTPGQSIQVASNLYPQSDYFSQQIHKDNFRKRSRGQNKGETRNVGPTKDDSQTVIVDESFDLNAFLRSQNMEQMEMQNNSNQFHQQQHQKRYANNSMDGDMSQMAKYYGIKAFHKDSGQLRNRPQPAIQKYDQVYKDLYKRAKNKKIADYFYQNDVVYPANASTSNVNSQFQSNGMLPSGKSNYLSPLGSQKNSIAQIQQVMHHQHQQPQQNIVHKAYLLPQHQQSKEQIIDLNKTYNIVENIKEVYGKGPLVRHQQQVVDSNSNDKDKWKEVMKFMQKNPKVLMQMIPNTQQDNDQAQQKQGFFQRRQHKGSVVQRNPPAIVKQHIDKIKKYSIVNTQDIKRNKRQNKSLIPPQKNLDSLIKQQPSSNNNRQQQQQQLYLRQQQKDAYVQGNKRQKGANNSCSMVDDYNKEISYMDMTPSNNNNNNGFDPNNYFQSYKDNFSDQNYQINHMGQQIQSHQSNYVQSAVDVKGKVQLQQESKSELNMTKDSLNIDFYQMQEQEKSIKTMNKNNNGRNERTLSVTMEDDNQKVIRQSVLEIENVDSLSDQKSPMQKIHHFNQLQENQISFCAPPQQSIQEQFSKDSIAIEMDQLNQEKNMMIQENNKLQLEKQSILQEKLRLEDEMKKLQSVEDARKEINNTKIQVDKEREMLELEKRRLEVMRMEIQLRKEALQNNNNNDRQQQEREEVKLIQQLKKQQQEQKEEQQEGAKLVLNQLQEETDRSDSSKFVRKFDTPQESECIEEDINIIKSPQVEEDIEIEKEILSERNDNQDDYEIQDDQITQRQQQLKQIISNKGQEGQGSPPIQEAVMSNRRQSNKYERVIQETQPIIEENEDDEFQDKFLRLTEENIEQSLSKAQVKEQDDSFSQAPSSDAVSFVKMMTPIPSNQRQGFGVRQESPTTSLKTYNGTAFGPLFDWAHSSIMEDVLNKKVQFNSDQNEEIFSEDELQAVIEQFRTKPQELKRVKQLESHFNKGLQTLKEILGLLNMHKLFFKINESYQQIDFQTTFKLLVRCRLMIQARNLVFQVLKNLQRQEQLTNDIKYVVESHLDKSIDDDVRSQIEILSLKLPRIVQTIRSSIVKLRDEFKILLKTAATTSKNNLVSNMFVYKKKDGLRYSIQTYEEVRKLVKVFDINKLPYITDKPESTTSNVIITNNNITHNSSQQQQELFT